MDRYFQGPISPNYLYRKDTCTRRSFFLDKRSGDRQNRNNRMILILPIAGAPQTTHTARESADIRVIEVVEWCNGSLSIQLFN